jgi:hypothetical protein
VGIEDGGSIDVGYDGFDSMAVAYWRIRRDRG